MYPIVSISALSSGDLSIINKTDNNWISKIKNVKSKERITMDSKVQIISSNLIHELLLNDFNLGWFRLIPDKNEYISNMDIIISMTYRVPRKVGIVG